MSEYQYYEFYAIDRELTNQEREEVDNLSSRFSPTSRRAVFSYSYSSFRHDEESILLKYFDFFLYLSNWGTKRIIYKFPGEIVDYQKIKKYMSSVDNHFADNGIRVYKKSKHVLVDINISEEDGEFWVEDENYISSDLIGIRNDILQGDYRSLFIMWLHMKRIELQFGQIDESLEIPLDFIPEDLGKLNSKLESLIRLYEIDIDWIKGASRYSISSTSKAKDYEELIKNLPVEKKDEYLMKILSGELNLRIRLEKELEPKKGARKDIDKGTITLQKLLKSVKDEELNRINYEKEESEKARVRRLKEFEKNKKVILKEIDYHIERGSGKSYDEALQRILNLKELSLYKNEENEFKKWIKSLKKKVAAKPAMIRRIENANL